MKDNLKISVYSGLGTLVILALLQPFGIDRVEGRILFVVSQSVIVALCVFVSQVLVNALFPKLYARRAKNLGSAIVRMIPCQLCIILLLSAALISFTCWFNTGSVAGAWFDESGFTLRHYFAMMIAVAILTVFIVFGLLILGRNNDLKDELNELKAINQLLEERQVKQESSASSVEPKELRMCTLESCSNQIKLVVNPADIIYIESMSNYADVCYLEEGETRHKTLRITMKQLREALSYADCIVSCHRAFMVNVNFILSISTRPTGGYQLQVFGQDTPIPVARAYTDEIKNRIK